MRSIFLIFPVLALVAIGAAFPVLAQTGGPALKRLNDRTDVLLKGKNENQLLQFEAIRNAHGVISSVNEVKRLIGKATKSCGAAQPDMQADIEQNFLQWREHVDPVLMKGGNRLSQMVDMQTVASPKEVRAYLKLVDKAFEERNNAQALVPATERKACEALIENMKDTRRDLVELITEALALDKELNVKKPAS